MPKPLINLQFWPNNLLSKNLSSSRQVYNSTRTTNAENETDVVFSVTSFCSDLSFWNDSHHSFERDSKKNYTYVNATGFENNNQGFLLHQLWIVNHYVKCLSNNLSNENINTGVSIEMIFQK